MGRRGGGGGSGGIHAELTLHLKPESPRVPPLLVHHDVAGRGLADNEMFQGQSAHQLAIQANKRSSTKDEDAQIIHYYIPSSPRALFPIAVRVSPYPIFICMPARPLFFDTPCQKAWRIG